MPGFSELPAMSIDPLRYGAETQGILAQSQLQQLNLQKAQALNPLEIQQQTALIPLATQEAQNKSKLDQINTSNKLIYQVIQQTKAAPPEDQQRVWDEGMQRAKDQGAIEAGQYVGHFRATKLGDLGDIYGGAGQDGSGGGQRETAAQAKAKEIDQAQIERSVATMPPDQLVKSLAQADLLVTSFNNVQGPNVREAWDKEIALLKSKGIDISKFFPSTEYSEANYSLAKQRIANLEPLHTAMANRAGALGIGATPPAPAPIGTSTYVGIDPDTGKPIYHNTTTNQDTMGQYAVNPKLTAGAATFKYKQQAALALGWSESDALKFASGQKTMSDEQMMIAARRSATAELGTFAYQNTEVANPEQWIESKAAQNFNQLKAAQAGGGQAPGRPAASAPPSAQLPPQALDALKKAGGQPRRFANGQIWKLVNGKPVRIR